MVPLPLDLGFYGFSTLVDPPEHEESSLMSVKLFEILNFDLVAQCIE